MATNPLRGKLSGTVPISIAVHLVVLSALVVVPLAATIDEYAPPASPAASANYIEAMPVPPPPAVVRHSSAPRPAGPTSAAPITAPLRLQPAADAHASITTPDVAGSSRNGIDGGIGSTIDVTPPIVRPADPPAVASTVRAALLPQPPRKIVDARPDYPAIARAARVEGTVILEAVLDPAGRVTHVRVLQSVPLLDEAAIAAVRLWRYTPTVYNGHSVSVLMTVTVRFQLQ